MSDESVAEKVYEAGLELVNPGGEPDVLRDAAKAWGDMGEALDKFVVHVDKAVREATGSQWYGPAADAFLLHWGEIKKSVEEAQPSFEEAKKGLNEAADKIEEINDEIHQIYLEIGVTIGVSVATSFITLGFSAAAGAANAARLAGQATAAAARLGRILATIAQWFQKLRNIKGWGHVFAFAGRTGIEFGNGVATSMLSGKGPEWENNLVGGVAGAGMGKVADLALGGRLGGGIGESIGIGVAGGASGSILGDAANASGPWADKDDEFDWSQALIGAAASGAGGGVGGGVTHGSSGGADGAASDGAAGDGASGGGTSGGEGGSSGSGSGESGSGGSGSGTGSGSGDGSGGSGANGNSGNSGDGSSGAEGSGTSDSSPDQLTDQQRETLRDEAAGSRIGQEFGVAGNRMKEADSLEDDLEEDQQKTADQLRGHANNTSLVDDFG
ncbi:WXG100 family type VII secretion target [Streptomyces sp. B-S-A8]|uniref:WXG100 family type VII secretion target n=1 Tax=Streptomyces solicavernae TaxID=3043614 RepID=A0ABT6RVE0_9ACTN|nr:WXG100 family type VII secretion target [Streptomyces sp. B-S-A8]MDI3388305.1 WXG100 family type VII secretion target [Streptomyces sp. B-S-A8]